MLTHNEMKLCSSLNLPATQYITLKTVLLSSADHSYAIRQDTPGGEGKSNVSRIGGGGGVNRHIDSIKQYLTSAGWLAGAY